MANARSSPTPWPGSPCSRTWARPQLLGVAGLFEEVAVAQDERVLLQGLTGSGFYVILDGSAEVRIDGTVRSILHRGDFFGEVSILLGEPPTADIAAITPLSCVVMGAAGVKPFLLAYPASRSGCS